MARGKPGPHQMDLAMDLLKMTDYTTDAGTDARNYGELEGLSRGTRPVCRCVRRKAQRGIRGRQLQPAADV